MMRAFRELAQRWTADADRLDAEAEEIDASTGGRKTLLSESARFSAAIYRLGAAILGVFG